MEKKSRAQKENEINNYWNENKIFNKSINNRPKNKQYVFFDGPPFATGLPHYGHILGLTSKDVYPRYWTMKGYRVERRWGWDCHGLPIENLAEKDLGIKQKREIENHGIKKFNNYCRSKVLSYVDEWKKTVNKLGKWIEFDNSYKTMDQTYMESVWWIFKTLHEKGLVYEDKKILMYCPRCETPIANAEIAMDNSYKDITENTLTAKFKLKNEENTYILAWTTTPWTLIGNVALAINSNIDYVKAKVGNEYLIFSKEYAKKIDNPKIVEIFKGKKLVNLEYEPLYHHETEKKGWKIINGGKEVLSEEGTGIVHMAIYGEFDFKMIKKYDLPIIQHVSNSGLIQKGPNQFIGNWFKKTDKLVIKDLEERGLSYKIEQYTHSYPFCYRCSTPLFYNAVNSWFFNIQKIKPKLLEQASKIDWHPKKMRTWFNDIIKTAPDWTISRNRFWATAIPVWSCKKCDKTKIIGSIKELQQNATKKIPNNIDLHKDAVDDVKFKCSCGGVMNRIPEVFDCWLESASMPYAELHYPFENKTEFKTRFPGDFVSEYVGQIRAWFYYMHVVGVMLTGKAPFKNIVATGTILASDGSKMSKSKNNFPDPNKILDSYGSDSLRFYLMGSVLMKANDLNFKEENLKDIYKKVIMILSNVNSFYAMFAKKTKLQTPNSKNVLDSWIISKLNQLIKDSTKNLDKYDTAKTCYDLTEFINELSTWYVRRSRDRFKGTDMEDKENAIQTLTFVLLKLSKVMAPITPFISEEIYQTIKENNTELKESVHLEDWPNHDDKLINKKIDQEMELVRQIVSMGLKKRDEAKIAVKQALKKITINGVKIPKKYEQIILEELNIKHIEQKDAKKLSVKLDTKLTKELLLEGYAREMIRNINKYRKQLGLTIQQRIRLHLTTIDEDVLTAFKNHQSEITYSTQTDQVSLGTTGKEIKQFKVNNQDVKISIEVL